MIVWNVAKLVFFSLLGMLMMQLLTGHWWWFWIGVGVLLVGLYVKRAAERRRRHARVHADIQRRVRELQHESYGR
jgi:hypothetical protein